MPETVGPPLTAVKELAIDEEMVVFNAATDRALVLNQTATDAWLLSDGTYNEKGLVEALARAYSVDPDEIRDDVLAVVRSFRNEGLLP